MNNFEPMIDIESTDRYENAKADLVKAYKSFNELTNDQKVILTKELFGAANVALICDALGKIMR